MTDVKQLRQNLTKEKEVRLQNVIALGELVHKSKIHNFNSEAAIEQLSQAILVNDQSIYHHAKEIVRATVSASTCSKCQSSIAPTAKFCGTCGQVNELYILNNTPTKECPKCVQQIDQTSQYCPCCGVSQGGI